MSTHEFFKSGGEMLQHDAAGESSIANGALSPCFEESNSVTSVLWKNDVKDLDTRFWG